MRIKFNLLFKKYFTSNFLIYIIFASGLILRIYNQPNHLWNLYGYDEARDMLVVNHIVKYGELLYRGPAAFGGMGSLANSAGYYYFISFFWFFFSSPNLFILFWSFISSLLIVLANKIGKMIDGKITGLIFASLVSFSPELIYEAKNLYQPHLLFPFVMLFLFFILKTNKQILDYVFAMFFLLLPLHFHYGILLILPIGLIWIFLDWLSFLKTHKFNWLNYSLPLFFLLLILVWIYSSYQVFPFDQFLFLPNTLKDSQANGLVYQFSSINTEFSKLFFRTENDFLLLLSLPLIFLSSFIYLKNHRSNQIKQSMCFLSLLSLSAFFAVFSKAQLNETYFLALLPIYFLLIALSIRTVISYTKKVGTVFFVLLILFSISISLKYDKSNYRESFFEEVFSISNVINQDYLVRHENELSSTDYSLAMISTNNTIRYDGWGTTPFWFALEDISKQKLVKITDENYAANHSPVNQNPGFIYFICEHRDGYVPNDPNACLEELSNQRDFLQIDNSFIIRTKNFTTWKFRVTADFPKDFYRSYENI